MELDYVIDDEQESFGFGDTNVDSSGEKCGICMDIVIDRGVLDCCQHWFCFSCIDNWATITNLCPLCQNQFQLITCVPVYDTIGNNSVDEDLQSRDDDWCIEGKNNTLSFPSYYIDENAVVCLDGDGCKVRSMPTSIEEYSNFDTSIACDSCDIWYHAFCVGFDTEGTCENSWLCPRCTVQHRSEELLLTGSSNQCASENPSDQCFVDPGLSGKVVVTVADDGETAVVVSMLEGKQKIKQQIQTMSSVEMCEMKEPFLLSDSITEAGRKSATVAVKNTEEQERTMVFLSSNIPEDAKMHASVPSSSFNNHKIETTMSSLMCEMKAPFQVSDSATDAERKTATDAERKTATVAVVKTEEQERTKDFSSSNITEDVKMHASLPSSFVNKQKLETPSNNRLSVGPNSMPEELKLALSQESSGMLPSNSESAFGDKGMSVPSDGSETSVSKLLAQCCSKATLKYDSKADDQVAIGDTLKECPLQVDETMVDKKDVNGSRGTKRKNRDWRGTEGETRAKTATKKINAEGSMQQIHARDQADECVKENTPKASGLTIVSQDKKTRANSDMNTVTTNIMDIIHETERLAETSSRSRENAAGLRVKKILRRPTEDKESSMLVQKLRKEIRDAVRNRTSKELGDNHFDPKLLTAFRAAVVGQVPEFKNSLPVDMTAKKSLLQKGKIRENLTKKIYGMGGRRRRAWTRDCDIEFWKYRCTKISKPEKIETLKSVLNLLRKSPESTEIKLKNESAGSSSILSRLYLADSSLFPRKEDIKPVSTMKAAGITGENKNVRSTEKSLTSDFGNNFSEILVTNVTASQMKVPPHNNATIMCTVPTLKGEVPSLKSKSNRCTVGSSISTVGASHSQKETNGKADDIKTDKRKWAQQFLARISVAGNNALQEQDDTAVLKGQHPLLAQLPRDMRPVLAVSRHNKIPISIRQAQLHRLTEYFLRKTNMPVSRRTAHIELAVADAVNIEKEAANRSNSKLVYVNLCSQELLHRSDSTLSVKAMESMSNPNPVPVIPADRLLKSTNDPSSCLAVDEALRNAGLLSDSPPNSPHHQLGEIDKADDSKRLVHEGPDNVFEIDSVPELDIYGDFEYDLQDEDFIGASTLKGSKLQAVEPKLKVVFSTIDSDRPNDTLELEDIKKPAIAMKPDNSSNCIDSTSNTSTGSLNINGKADKYDPQYSLLDEGEELSLAECEELYGPDREPLITKFPESVFMKPYESIVTNLVPDNNKDNGSSQTLEASDLEKNTLARNPALTTVVGDVEYESKQSRKCTAIKEKTDSGKQQDGCNSVHKKVEAYIKEHIRPLCKSGVINVEQYRWAVGKTTDKIMKYHQKDKNANFLIKEGEKVKKLAEQYVESAQTQRA